MAVIIARIGTTISFRENEETCGNGTAFPVDIIYRTITMDMS